MNAGVDRPRDVCWGRMRPRAASLWSFCGGAFRNAEQMGWFVASCCAGGCLGRVFRRRLARSSNPRASSLQAMERHTIERDVAAYVKKQFDEEFDPTWHCIVGRHFGACPKRVGMGRGDCCDGCVRSFVPFPFRARACVPCASPFVPATFWNASQISRGGGYSS